MAKNIGILLNPETLDLLIKPQRDAQGKITQGLVVGDITAQNQAMILQAYPGEFKENPEIGVGIDDIVLDNDLLAWRSKIRKQIENEGQTINTFDVKQTTNGKFEIIIDAKY